MDCIKTGVLSRGDQLVPRDCSIPRLVVGGEAPVASELTQHKEVEIVDRPIFEPIVKPD